jgi:uncharacterized protein (TIGR03435 family)
MFGHSLLQLAATLLVLSGLLTAQAPTPPQSAEASRLTFEVASIKQNKSGSARGGADAQPGGRVAITNTSLHDLIRYAFALQRSEMVTGERAPSWIESDRWDINAKGPEQASQQQLQTMLKNLLIDRVKLLTKREVRNIPTYARTTED